MGLDLNGVRFLLYTQRLGANFEQTAMIGRQSLDLTRFELKNSLKAFGHPATSELTLSIFSKSDGYAEPLLTQLGAKRIHSFDVSAYEGATHLHDMNKEIPPEIMEQYSVVLDGGSLEHVFNLPIAIKNCMEMLKIGGHYLGITPANNFMGHGFYQFSPELYFSIFTHQNGFELIKLIAFEDMPGSTWYSVRNPEEVKGRVQLINSQPVYLLMLAKKLAKVPIFESTPQQSDYVASWNQSENLNSGRNSSILRRATLSAWVKRNLPFPIIHLIKSLVQGSGFNPRLFTPMDPIPAKRFRPGNKKH